MRPDVLEHLLRGVLLIHDEVFLIQFDQVLDLQLQDDTQEPYLGVICLVERTYVDQELLVVVKEADALLNLSDLVVDAVH
jgi:hypothetical protein